MDSAVLGSRGNDAVLDSRVATVAGEMDWSRRAACGPASTTAMTNAQATAELERIEQHITLTLQRIDGNFAACHEAACALLVAAEKQLDASGKMWAGQNACPRCSPWCLVGQTATSFNKLGRQRKGDRWIFSESRRSYLIPLHRIFQPWARFFESLNASKTSRVLLDESIDDPVEDGDQVDDLLGSSARGKNKSNFGAKKGHKRLGIGTGKRRESFLPATPSIKDHVPPTPSLLRNSFKSKGDASSSSSSSPSFLNGRPVNLHKLSRTFESTSESTGTPPSLSLGIHFASNEASPNSPTFSPPVTLAFGGATTRGMRSTRRSTAGRRVTFSACRGSLETPVGSSSDITPLTRRVRRMSISKRGTAETPSNSARKRAKEILAYVANSPVPPLPPSSTALRRLISSAGRGGRLRDVTGALSISPSPFSAKTKVEEEEEMRAQKELEEDIDRILDAVNSDALDLSVQIAEAREFGVSESESEEETEAQKLGGDPFSSPMPAPPLFTSNALLDVSAGRDSPPAPMLAATYIVPPAVQPPPPADDLTGLFEGVRLDDEDEADNAVSYPEVEEPTVDLLGPRLGPASEATSFAIRTNPYERRLQQIKRKASSSALIDESGALLRPPLGGSADGVGMGAEEDVTIGMGRSSKLPVFDIGVVDIQGYD